MEVNSPNWNALANQMNDNPIGSDLPRLLYERTRIYRNSFETFEKVLGSNPVKEEGQNPQLFPFLFGLPSQRSMIHNPAAMAS